METSGLIIEERVLSRQDLFDELMSYRMFYEDSYGNALYYLNKANGVPMTAKQIADRRIKFIHEHPQENNSGWFAHFSTPDAVAFHGEEAIKIIPNCEILVNYNANIRFPRKYEETIDGAIILTEEQYRKLEGRTLHRSELNLRNLLTKQEILEHPVWQIELGSSLESYVEAMFEMYEKDSIKRNISLDKPMKSMPVYLEEGQDKPTLRPINLGNSYGSILGCDDISDRDAMKSDFRQRFDAPACIAGAVRSNVFME